MLYEFLQERFGTDEPADAQSTGSIPPQTTKPSQQTLRPDDLTPPWRGPHSRDNGRTARSG
jgi:hypothetical protein